MICAPWWFASRIPPGGVGPGRGGPGDAMTGLPRRRGREGRDALPRERGFCKKTQERYGAGSTTEHRSRGHSRPSRRKFATMVRDLPLSGFDLDYEVVTRPHGTPKCVYEPVGVEPRRWLPGEHFARDLCVIPSREDHSASTCRIARSGHRGQMAHAPSRTRPGPVDRDGTVATGRESHRRIEPVMSPIPKTGETHD